MPATTTPSADIAPAGPAPVFVTLTLAEQLCALPVRDVRDVLGEHPITRIPLAPPEIAGSLNLRGRIVTAIDLRRRLRLAGAPAGAPRMSVVAELGSDLYALLVDQVGEVVSPPPSAFERNPPTLSPIWADHSLGIYRLQEQLMVVLDIGRLLALARS